MKILSVDLGLGSIFIFPRVSISSKHVPGGLGMVLPIAGNNIIQTHMIDLALEILGIFGQLSCFLSMYCRLVNAISRSIRDEDCASRTVEAHGHSLYYLEIIIKPVAILISISHQRQLAVFSLDAS